MDRLSPESRRLLDRLAMLAPDPIPNALLDVPVPGDRLQRDRRSLADSIRNFVQGLLGIGAAGTAGADSPRDALTGLYSYSLATQAKGGDGASQGFIVHRLIQEFARRAMTAERRAEVLREAMGWVNEAFTGDPQDVGS